MNFINSLPDIIHEQSDNKIYNGILYEMSRINVKEFYGLFPYNKFDIKIWSNDHNPPHFHVFCDGWNIVFEIENGKYIKTERIGSNSKIESFVKDNIKEWLASKSASQPDKTNQQVAWEEWNRCHQNIKINNENK